MFLGPWLPSAPHQPRDTRESLKRRSSSPSAVLHHPLYAPPSRAHAPAQAAPFGADPRPLRARLQRCLSRRAATLRWHLRATRPRPAHSPIGKKTAVATSPRSCNCCCLFVCICNCRYYYLLFNSYISYVLIHPLILLHQCQQSLESLHPIGFKLSRIKSLTVSLHPVQHIMLLQSMLRRIAMIGFNKTNHLLVSYVPPLFLCV